MLTDRPCADYELECGPDCTCDCHASFRVTLASKLAHRMCVFNASTCACVQPPTKTARPRQPKAKELHTPFSRPKRLMHKSGSQPDMDAGHPLAMPVRPATVKR